MVCFHVVQNNDIFKQKPACCPYLHGHMDWLHKKLALTIPYNTKQCKVTNHYVAHILCVNGHGSPFWSPSHRHGHQTMDQTTRLDSTGLEHQHWIAAARGIIETLTLDPVTEIFCPFVSCLLHTKTGQHSLPPCTWSQELCQGLLNSADGVLPLIPILPKLAKDAWLPNPNEIYPNLQEEPSIHPRDEINTLLHPYWRNVWLQNPNEIYPNLQKEFCIHPPDKVNPLLYPHWRNA